jgi:hypothetical protein
MGKMKRKYWWLFGAIQVAGVVANINASHLQDGILSAITLLGLLPGSLISAPLILKALPQLGLWGIVAIAVAANTVLFGALAPFLERSEVNQNHDVVAQVRE